MEIWINQDHPSDDFMMIAMSWLYNYFQTRGDQIWRDQVDQLNRAVGVALGKAKRSGSSLPRILAMENWEGLPPGPLEELERQIEAGKASPQVLERLSFLPEVRVFLDRRSKDAG